MAGAGGAWGCGDAGRQRVKSGAGPARRGPRGWPRLTRRPSLPSPCSPPPPTARQRRLADFQRRHQLAQAARPGPQHALLGPSAASTVAGPA